MDIIYLHIGFMPLATEQIKSMFPCVFMAS